MYVPLFLKKNIFHIIIDVILIFFVFILKADFLHGERALQLPVKYT
jgi:hypothetical protein